MRSTHITRRSILEAATAPYYDKATTSSTSILRTVSGSPPPACTLHSTSDLFQHLSKPWLILTTAP